MHSASGPSALESADQLDQDERRRGIVDLRRHTARGMLITSAYQIGLVALSAVRMVVVAAFLTRAAYGLWGLLGMTLWTAMGLKMVFGANEKYVQQSDSNQEHAFQEGFTVEVLFAAVSVPVAVAVVFAFAALTGHHSIVAPGLVLVLMLPSTALQFAFAPLYRQMQFRRQRTLGAVEPLLGTLLMIALAAIGTGYWSLVIGTVVGSWAGAVVALRACPYRVTLRYNRAAVRAYVSFSAPLLIMGVSVLAMYQVIVLVGNDVLGLAGLGAFILAGNLLQFTDQADAIVTETMYPAVCAVRDKTVLLSELFVKSNRLSLMWAVPFGIGLTLFSPDLAHFVLGARWSPAVPLLEIMGIVTAIHHVGFNWAAFLKARGITWPLGVMTVIGAAATIAAAVPLMYSDHLVGLAWAFAIGEGVNLVLRAAVIARFFEGVTIFSQLFRGFAPTLVAAVPVVALQAFGTHARTLPEALAIFGLYLVLTALATLTFERPLLREAASYVLPKREPGLAFKPRTAG